MTRWSAPAALALALTTMLAPGRATALDIHVPQDFPTIVGALAVANAGDTVLVAEGDYAESWLVLPGGVDLIGEGPNLTRILATSPVATILYTGANSRIAGIGFSGGDVAIDGDDLDGPLAISGCAFKEFNIAISLANDPAMNTPETFEISGNLFDVCEIGVEVSFFEGSNLRLVRNVLYWADVGLRLHLIDDDFSSEIKLFNNVLINMLTYGFYVNLDGVEPLGADLLVHHNVMASFSDGLTVVCEAEGGGALEVWNNIVHEGMGNAVYYQNQAGDCFALPDVDWVGSYNGGNLTGVPLPTWVASDAAPFFNLDWNSNDYLDNDLRLSVGSPYIDFGTPAALGLDPDGTDPDLGIYGGPEASQWDYDLDGSSLADGDCDDFHDKVYPGAVEECDGLDNDCNGALSGQELDQDNDGHRVCDGDCDDTRADVYPGAFEGCDGHPDNDCDGILDPTDMDDDGDGFSLCSGDCDESDPNVNPGVPEVHCDQIDNACDGIANDDENLDGDPASVCDGDCDDADPTRYPGAPELCDGIDNDCDEQVPPDEFDADGDSYPGCAGDCDEGDVNINPGMPEVPCDGVDNDCEPATGDEPDLDGDGHGLCDGDCDDSDPGVHPDAAEDCGDGADNDCDGLVDAADVDDCGAGDDDTGDDDTGDDDTGDDDTGDDDTGDDDTGDDDTGDDDTGDDDTGDDDTGDDDTEGDDDDTGPSGFTCRCSGLGARPAGGLPASLFGAALLGLLLRRRGSGGGR